MKRAAGDGRCGEVVMVIVGMWKGIEWVEGVCLQSWWERGGWESRVYILFRMDRRCGCGGIRLHSWAGDVFRIYM